MQPDSVSTIRRMVDYKKRELDDLLHYLEDSSGAAVSVRRRAIDLTWLGLTWLHHSSSLRGLGAQYAVRGMGNRE